MKLAIITPTYYKLDGSTYNHLKEAIKSLKNQEHQDFKLFLIGDNYAKPNELFELANILHPNQIYIENLPVAVEREKYSNRELWRVGGANASNVGIKLALNENLNYVCHLDHDDLFLPNHLKIISECIKKTNTNFISTACGKFPPINTTKLYSNYRPESNKLFKVSVCLNYNYFNMFFRDVLMATGKSYASDADLWNRINDFLTKNNEYGIFINKQSCLRNGGGTTWKNPEIVK